MSLKVCLYIASFSPGGAQRQIVNLAGELAGRGVRVTLLHVQKELQEAWYLDAIRGKGVELLNVVQPDFLKQGILLSKRHADFYANIPAPPSLRLGVLYLAGAFSRLKPDIVHSYLDLTNCIAGCAVVLAGVPHLASFRSLDPVTHKSVEAEPALPLYRYLLAHGRPHFEANSRAGAMHYARWLGIEPGEIAYSPNGFDPSVLRPPSAPAKPPVLRETLGIPPSAPVILTLSRFVWAKAPEAMLEVFARVHAARPESHFLIAGWGMSDAEEMGAMVRDRGLDSHVHLLGVQGDVGALMSSANVFLLPSRVEGFPNAIMEAMALGLPVVASNVGGIPDLVRHDQDGFLHEAEDVDGMAQSVLTLMADADMRARFGAAGRQRIAREFSLQKLGDRALHRYEELLAEHGRDRQRSGAAE